MTEASLEVRRISHKMSPRSLEINGLKAALNDMVLELDSSTDIAASFEWNGELVDIPDGSEIVIYRIVQELLANIMKHAGAREIFIQVNVFDNEFNLMVEDDGMGFDVDNRQANGGLGLAGIASRVEFLKGTFDIDSTVGEGTTISVNFPI